MGVFSKKNVFYTPYYIALIKACITLLRNTQIKISFSKIFLVIFATTYI